MDLVFDIGGTFLRVAESDPNSRTIGPTRTFDTPNFFDSQNLEKSIRGLTASIIDAAENVAEGRDINAVCIGFPGPVDDVGNILAAPTVWGRQADQTIPFKETLMAMRPTWQVRIVNDVAAAGYNYVTSDRQDFLILTVGSGVGSKVFLNGTPMTGPNFRAGEIGHLKVDFSETAAMCDCGERGHIGATASGRGVLRFVRAQAELDRDGFKTSALHEMVGSKAGDITNSDIVQTIRAQDPWVTEKLVHCTRPLAQTMAAMHLHCGIEKFIVIGGFAQAMGTVYTRLLARLAASMAWRNGFDWGSAIEKTDAADNPGLNGAHRLLRSAHQTGDPHTDRIVL